MRAVQMGASDCVSKNSSLHDINLRLQRVINATGVVLHTNLGRAPLAEPAVAALAAAARDAVDLG